MAFEGTVFDFVRAFQRSRCFLKPLTHFLSSLIQIHVQLTIIADKLGKLPDSDLDFVTSDKAKRFMKKLPNKSPVHLSLQFPDTPVEALDVMRKMLEIHPNKRLTIDHALQHPFFEALHNPADEPVSSRPFDFSFENEKLHRVRLQELIWEEVGDFRPFALPVAPIKGIVTTTVSTDEATTMSKLTAATSNSRTTSRS